MEEKEYYEWTIRIPKRRKILGKAKLWSPLWIPAIWVLLGAIFVLDNIWDYVYGLMFGIFGVLYGWLCWDLVKRKNRR